jgi:cell division protein FtsW (lipid II flippase)
MTAVGAVVFAAHADPVWLLVALLVVLLVGAFFAFSEASERARVTEWKAARTDVLEKRVTELSKELAVSQAQYKVLRDFKPPSAT